MNDNQQRDEQTVVVLRHFFHTRFCAEENVTEEQKPFVTPAYFYGWLHKAIERQDQRDGGQTFQATDSTLFDAVAHTQGGCPHLLQYLWDRFTIHLQEMIDERREQGGVPAAVGGKGVPAESAQGEEQTPEAGRAKARA